MALQELCVCEDARRRWSVRPTHSCLHRRAGIANVACHVAHTQSCFAMPPRPPQVAAWVPSSASTPRCSPGAGTWGVSGTPPRACGRGRPFLTPPAWPRASGPRRGLKCRRGALSEGVLMHFSFCCSFARVNVRSCCPHHYPTLLSHLRSRSCTTCRCSSSGPSRRGRTTRNASATSPSVSPRWGRRLADDR